MSDRPQEARDIVERLEDEGDIIDAKAGVRLCGEAAEEILRLRAENARLREALDTCATQLAHCLGPNTEAGRMAARALSQPQEGGE